MDTESIKKYHRKLVGRAIEYKLGEFNHFLSKIIRTCKSVESKFDRGIQPADEGEDNINYVFNAFVNTFQSIIDALQTATDAKIDWKRFNDVPHSKFIKNCRNAVAHDGMQVINAYADGKYYVAAVIERIDNRGSVVVINPPKEDILTVCVEFARGLIKEIMCIIEEHGRKIPLYDHTDYEQFFKEAMDSTFIPQFAIDLMKENELQIKDSIKDLSYEIQPGIQNKIDEIERLLAR